MLEQWERIHRLENNRLPSPAYNPKYRDPTSSTMHAAGLVVTHYDSVPDLVFARSWANGLIARVRGWADKVSPP